MSKQTDLLKKKETLNLLDSSMHIKENVVKISRHERPEHALGKFLLAYELISNGDDIITEAIFKNGKRADILSLKEGVAYEVLCSEKPENILKKQESYPVRIKAFKAKELIKTNLKAFL